MPSKITDYNNRFDEIDKQFDRLTKVIVKGFDRIDKVLETKATTADL